MTETEKIDRTIEIVEFNRYVVKGLRRFIIKWMKGIEREIKLQYSDIQKMKNIIIAIGKKIKLEGIEDLGEMEEPEELGEQSIPKSEKDLVKVKPKINRKEWSYFA